MTAVLHDPDVPTEDPAVDDAVVVDLGHVRPQDLTRLVEVVRVLARHGVVTVARTGGTFVLHPRRQPPRALAVALRRSFADLGPTFIKLGQLIASSPGLFPAFLAVEMRRLLDDVPPESTRRIRRTVARELGAPIGHLFASFDAAPLAAASVAQVHRARLRDGRGGGGQGPASAPPWTRRAGPAPAPRPGRPAGPDGGPRRDGQPRRDRRRPRPLDARGARLPPRGARHGPLRGEPGALRHQRADGRPRAGRRPGGGAGPGHDLHRGPPRRRRRRPPRRGARPHRAGADRGAGVDRGRARARPVPRRHARRQPLRHARRQGGVPRLRHHGSPRRRPPVRSSGGCSPPS